VSGLEKAVLEELDKAGKPVGSSAVPVQFNPTSLKLQMTNSTDGAASRGRQVQQYNGSASTSLSVQLEFDSADEGSTDAAVDVRTRTAQVARFVLPGAAGSKQAPPRVQFRWGTVIVGGVMTSMSEELTLFSAQGVPLRSSVSIEIKQQDPKFEALESGPGANPDTAAPPAGEPSAGAGPGTAGDGTGGPDTRTAEALDGESAADFLTRNGLDPSAWRAIAGLLDDPLTLSAGLAVDFSASLSVQAGIGVALGIGAELDVSVGSSLGLEVDAGAGASAASGFALAAAGGLTAAAQTLAGTEAAAAASQARSAFATPVAPPAAPAPDAHLPLAAAPTARTLSPEPAAPRPLPPRADPRATSFGRGVPLRDRVVPVEASAGTGGWVVVAPRPPAPPPATATSRAGCGCSAGTGRAGCGCSR
jgi:hypothetical protein